MIRNGSKPRTIESGSGSSGDTGDRSCSLAKKPDERAAKLAGVVPNRPLKHGIVCLKGIEDSSLSYRARDGNIHFVTHAGEQTQTSRKLNAND
jgi:hypothetical protein